MQIDTSAAPANEYSCKFFQYMINRIGFGFARYKGWKASRERGIDFLKSARDRIKMYEETSNTEFLVDAANLLMGEFIVPSLPDAHFEATSGTPGMIDLDGARIVVKGD